MTNPSPKPLRVLLVEDVQSDADLLIRHLTRAGFAVDHRRVDSALSMRRALDEGGWELILCDYALPGFDAPAALALCREHSLDIPFLVISGTIGEETAVAMMKAGAHDYLLKDNLGRLIPVVERELRETDSRRRARLTDEALRRSEASLRAFYESGVLGVVYWSIHGPITDANDRFLDMVGYTRDELSAGKIDWVAMTPPELRHLDDRAVAELKATGRNQAPFEKEYIRKDGTRLPIALAGAMIDQEREHGVAFVLDISARKRAEEAQARRQQEIAALGQVISATTSTLDLQRVLDALLDNLRTLAGAERASVMLLEPKTDCLVMVAAKGSNGRLPASLRLAPGAGAAGQVVEDGKPVIVPDVTRFPRFVPPSEQAVDPTIKPPLTYAGFPLVSHGRIIGVASLATTTPKEYLPEEVSFIETICRAASVSIDNALAHQQIQRHAEELTGEMAVHRNYAENVLGSITDGVASTDTNRRIVSWNPGAETIMGYTAEEAIGKPCSEIFREVGPDGTSLSEAGHCLFDEVEHSRRPCNTREVSSLRRDGRPVALSLSAAPLVDNNGELQGLVLVFRDFSYERTLLDNVQRASRAKSLFLANMSHEIRTPLNAILGFSQILLKDSALATSHRQYLDVIAKSGEHLLTLIDDILEMSKIEAGRTPLAACDFNLRELLEDLTGMFRLRAETKGLGFAVAVANGAPAALLADKKKLRQILINLLGNAIKFTSKGFVRCNVEVWPGAGGASRLVVDVEDTGPGVSADDAERIFRAFEQAGAGTGGTGLGLAISREFAQVMGGDISLRSHEGPGAHFRLDVPVSVGTSDESSQVVSRARVIGIKAGLGPFHVMVVDDQFENRLLLVEMLAAIGFQPREVASGEEAIALAAEWSPHAILMDVRMPGMGGLEAIRRLRAMEPLRHIPIIAVSASAFEEDRKLALAAGASDFLGKPFREFELLELLRTGLAIDYIYLGETAEQAERPGEAPARRSRVRLPARIVEQLRQAADRADYEHIIEILDALGGTAPEAAATLRRIVERYDYQGLLDQVETSDEREPS